MRTNIGRCLVSLIALLTLGSCILRASGQASGDSGQLSVCTLTNLQRGIGMEELIKITGVKPEHQFTARIGTNEMLCVKLSFERPRGRLYFTFRGGRLVAVQKPPATEFETKSYQGKPWRVPKPVDSELKMTSLLEGADLSCDELIEVIKEWAQNEAIYIKAQESKNLLPAFVLVASQEKALAPARSRSEREAAQLVEKFNPLKVKLGMDATEIQSVLGKPTDKIRIAGNCEQHVYGAELPPHVSNLTRPVWLSVVLCEGRVTRVFSHDFFDKRLLGAR